MEILTIAWAAFFLDCVLGDPRSPWHPVILLGRAISFLEKCLLRPKQSDRQKLWAGTVLVICLLGSTYLIIWGIFYLLQRYLGNYPQLASFAAALLLSATISPRSLAEAGQEIYHYLVQGDLAKARFKVGWIVGRDTENLDAANITRATVETIAENIVDGIISPLFYFFIGGLPLAMLYRAVNTMDSMIGYKNDTYLYFGRAAARLDDVLNFIPARLTGVLLVAMAFLWRLDFRGSWKMLRRDAKKHPSPNGGYPEAAVAGALGIRLGGLNYYFGKPSFRSYMGEALQELMPAHIQQTIHLLYGTTLAFLLLASAAIILGGGIAF